jgi:VanZ family protein
MRPAMPSPNELLHRRRFHAHWRTLLAVLCATAGWFAFTPGQPPGPDFDGVDKLHHLLAFGSMATAGLLGWPVGRQAALRVAAGLLAYGALIELVQSQLPTRSADGLDLLTDAAGIGCGLLLAARLRRRWPDTTG